MFTFKNKALLSLTIIFAALGCSNLEDDQFKASPKSQGLTSIFMDFGTKCSSRSIEIRVRENISNP